jgi:transposase-like protein
VVYTAATVDAAAAAFAEFEADWGSRYPAIIRLLRNAWDTFIPFLTFPPEIRRVVYTTNAIWVFNSAGWLGRCYPGRRSRRWALTLNANDAVRLSWIRSARAHRVSADAGRLA